MCLIITALSALISFILLKIKGYRFFKELFIMFFSAALMWTMIIVVSALVFEGAIEAKRHVFASV